MKTIARPLVAITIALVSFSGCVSVPSDLGEAEAVRLAEAFIVANGYTDLPPTKSKFSYESIEFETDVDKNLQQRHATLERKAWGVASQGRGKDKGWIVGFRLANAPDGKIGRAVTMGFDGRHIRVQHQAYYLDALKRL